MTLFDYRARDRNGGVHEGAMEGPSAAAVATMLRSKGFIPLKVEAKQDSVFSREFSIPGLKKRIKAKDVAVFSRQLSTMINSGLTLTRSLAVLEQQTENSELRIVAGRVRERVEQGTSLSAAMEEHPKVFDKLYVAMVRAGETGGVLDETMLRLAETLESSVRLRSKVRSAMAYPAVVMSLIVVVVVAMLVFVVPVFEQMYADLGGGLPIPTQILIVVSSALASFWWLAGLTVAGAVVGFRRWKRTERGQVAWGAFTLRVPIFGGLVRKVAISRFARTLSVLSRSGVPMLAALDIVADTAGNAQVRAGVLDIRASVKRGDSLAAPLTAHPVFPPMVTQMMVVGEETGAMDEMLRKVSDFYDQEVETTVGALTSLIEPLLIIVMGVTVGAILIALYLPMFNIASLIQ
jgi:type IV pilus assembly protein PilC